MVGRSIAEVAQSLGVADKQPYLRRTCADMIHTGHVRDAGRPEISYQPAKI